MFVVICYDSNRKPTQIVRNKDWLASMVHFKPQKLQKLQSQTNRIKLKRPNSAKESICTAILKPEEIWFLQEPGIKKKYPKNIKGS